MIRFENVLKISLQEVLKASWRRLEDVLKTFLQDVLKTSWQDVLKTSWRHLEDAWPKRIYWSWPRRFEDVLKTSSEDVRLRRTYSSWSRRLPKTKTKDVFKTSSRRLHQDECLLVLVNHFSPLIIFVKELYCKTLAQFRLGVSLICLFYIEDEERIGKKLYFRKIKYITSTGQNFKVYLQ